MGFKAPKREFKLVFADPELQGLEVRMRTSTIAKALEFQRLGASAQSELDKTDALVRLASDALVEWNLEDDDDAPVPATYDGLAAQEGYVFWAIWNAWIEAVMGVSGPLAGGSTSGEASPEQPVPTAALSLDQSSTPTPAGS